MIKINVASVDGPAIYGMANGTINGSSSRALCDELSGGKIIFKAIKNNIADVNFNPEDFVFDMKVSVSLWIDDAGTLSFAHRSLQEYFAASFIKDLVEDSTKERIYKKLLSHCEACRNTTEMENFLSLCEEMDTVNFYKYFHLPVCKEIYTCINIGDVKKNIFEFL